LAVVAGMILLYQIYNRITRKEEYIEQLTVKGVVEEEKIEADTPENKKTNAKDTIDAE